MNREPNHKLISLMTEAGASSKGLARRLRDLGAQRGALLGTTHVSVQRWRDGGGIRPDTAVLLCEIMSSLLRRPVTFTDLGFAREAPSSGKNSPPPAPDHEALADGTVPGHVGRAARESLGFANSITTNVTDETLSYLSDDLARIATAYVHAPILPLFGELTEVRNDLFQLLNGRQKPRHTRELFYLAGTTCLLLAHASQNLGDHRSALAQVHTADTCARQADHHGLLAWTAGTAALIAEWSPRPRRALQHIDRATALAPAGESRIRLAAIEARTAARIGDHHRAAGALRRMSTARDETPAPDTLADFGGILTFPAPKQDYYTGSTHSLLGNHTQAEHHATRAIEQYLRGPREERSYGDEALATVDIITARLAQGDVDAAATALQPLLALPPGQRIQQLGDGMQRITHALRRAPLLPNPTARELAGAITAFQVLDGATPALPSPR
ncbi:XRE family transcriptional regulator [Streptomyces sp. NPDC057638]|uniref:XRE family transcriptional regulator n=1 Tax=Streptomyces sp. NPDC057638 TaxID=3346190 RepID=UPI00369A8B03